MTNQPDQTAEARFRTVFSHLGLIVAYAQRRGSRDADAIAAEVMTIAWRRLADVPADDPRPWLYATARYLVLAEARRTPPTAEAADWHTEDAPEPFELDPALSGALQSLSRLDREALLLTAWEDLTPTQAAKALGINPTAFRVRLLRARRRLQAKLKDETTPRRPNAAHLDLERT